MFKEKTIKEWKGNPFLQIGQQWMLICAGDAEGYNMMTASWGGVGVLWNLNVSTIYVRPQRYTREFIDRHGYYTLCFFSEAWRKALNICGTTSGRDVDKAAATGLTPVHEAFPGTGGGYTYFAEASLVIVCRKLYTQELKPACFTDKTLDTQYYGAGDYHRQTIGEIVRILERPEAPLKHIL